MNRQRRLLAIGASLGTAFAALYFLTRTPGLDEWDSVNFALGLHDFNLWKHQPHPPGYPLYLGAAWLACCIFGLGTAPALQLVSAIGGGLAVGSWFVIAARKFRESTAWLTALTLGCLLISWMSATKALTDPFGAGLLALTLALAEDHPSLSGAAAAAAVGARPQNIPAILVILALNARRDRQWARRFGWFVGGCLCWLLPTAWLQAHTPESADDPLAYARQLFHQWQWRLDQPQVYLGAPGQNSDVIEKRLERHFVDWFARGFGFKLTQIWGWVGISMLSLGWTLHALALHRDDEAGAKARTFWSGQWTWALLYITVVFCCLPGDQRYYLPIFPLLTLAAVAGWQTLPGRWTWMAAVVPAATLATAFPFIVENHRVPAPPLQAIDYLRAKNPAPERANVWLILRDNRRHADWYATDFHIVRAEDFNPRQWPANWSSAHAIYTDESTIAAAPPPGARWRLVASFSRSALIYRKHSETWLWLLTH